MIAIPSAIDRLEQLVAAFCRIFMPPPPPRPLLEYAGHIKLRNRDDPQKPPQGYVVGSHGPQSYVLWSFQCNRYRYILVLGPIQDGKTLASMVIPMLYCLFELGQHAVYGLPDMNVAAKQYRGKVLQAIIDSGYGHMLPKSGRGSGGGVSDDIQFTNGARLYLMGAGAQNEAGQSAITVRFSFIDELDSIRPNMVQLIRGRTKSYNELARNSSTTTLKQIAKRQKSAALAAYEESTRCRVEHRCVHCHQFQTYEWPQVTADLTSSKGAWDNAAITCVHCKVAMSPEQWRESLSSHRMVSIDVDGRVHEQLLESETFGLRWTALDSPRKNLRVLCQDYYLAWVQKERHYDHALMRQFFRDELVLPYAEDDEASQHEVSDTILTAIANASTYRKGEVPQEAEVIIVGEDCQLRSHYWMATAFAWDRKLSVLRWWLIDWNEISVLGGGQIPTAADRQATLDLVDQVCETGWHRRGDDQVVRALAAVVDTGYKPNEVRPWVARHRRRWLSIRGAGRDLIERMKYGERQGKVVRSVKDAMEVRLQENTPDRLQGFVDATKVGDEIASGWLNGLGQLPSDIDSRLVSSLLGTKRTPDGWIDANRRHDYWDILVYQIARARDYFSRPITPPPRYGVVGSMIKKTAA